MINPEELSDATRRMEKILDAKFARDLSKPEEWPMTDTATSELVENPRWLPMETAPKHGRRIYGLSNDGKALVIYANPELSHDLYLGWWPLPEHGRQALQSIQPQERSDEQ